MSGKASGLRVDHAVVSGTFSLDGETHDVDNNIWVVGDDEECLVIDAPHDVDAILAVVGGRQVKAIVCTHAHDDHVRVAPALRVATGAPILLHPDDRPLWELTHGGDEPGAELWDVDLSDGMTLTIGGAAVTGGVGTVTGAIIGGLIMGVLNNGMSLLGLGTEVQSFIKGFVLLLAVAFDIFNKRRAANASK